MKLTLRGQDFHKIWMCRNINTRDTDSLAKLMLEAYRDTIDYSGETLEDAISEVQGTFGGKYGSILENCSFLTENNEQIVSTTIITWWQENEDVSHIPLLAFCMTCPSYKNQGMATFLIKKSINALFAQGYTELYLFVTEANTPARHLYEKIGFIDDNSLLSV
jgi:predicted GNAT family acetyltransferase